MTTPLFPKQPANLQEVYDLSSLAALLGLSGRQLGYYLYKRKVGDQYTTFEISKKSGGKRQISAPAPNLKILQRNLLRLLVELRSFRPYITGFIKNRGITANADLHVGKRFVLNIDLEDFFGTINFGRVFGTLISKPYYVERRAAAAIAKATVFQNKLPQGAPTSPILSNLVAAKLDSDLKTLCKANGCTYSRYADDITISAQKRNFPLAHRAIEDGQVVVQLNAELRATIEVNGFRINDAKTRLHHRTDRQEVTGLVVNERVNVKRRFIRDIRAILNALEKHPVGDVQTTFVEKFEGKTDILKHLEGRISFVGQVRGRNDQIYRRLAARFNAIVGKQRLKFDLTPLEIVKQAIWVLESLSDPKENRFIQGTAFFLENVGIVTCEHCVVGDAHLYHRDRPGKTFPVKLVARDYHRDLAVFEIPEDLKSVVPLRLSNEQYIEQSDVALFGYPKQASARPIRIERGKLLRVYPRNGVTLIEISPKIIEGNSGGPVTNDKSEVLGVASNGINEKLKLTEAEFLAISTSEIKAFLKENSLDKHS